MPAFHFINISPATIKPVAAMAALLLWLIVTAPPGHATTLLEMNIDEVAGNAELVFEGTVIEAQALGDSTGSINTYITFAVREVIKGEFNQDTLELKFMGGTLDGRIVEVSGMQQPRLGETGIYFVESTSRDLVNPLLGWSQGHFLIATDVDGIARVTTPANKPVRDIQPVTAVPAAIRKPLAIIEGSSDSASGIITEQNTLLIERALSAEDFKARIRQLISEQSD